MRPPHPDRARRALAVALLVGGAGGCGTPVFLGGVAGDAGVDQASGCAAFAPPSASSTCQACDPKESNCQANGCYNGYVCDRRESDCKDPKTPCPDGG